MAQLVFPTCPLVTDASSEWATLLLEINDHLAGNGLRDYGHAAASLPDPLQPGQLGLQPTYTQQQAHGFVSPVPQDRDADLGISQATSSYTTNSDAHGLATLQTREANSAYHPGIPTNPDAPMGQAVSNIANLPTTNAYPQSLEQGKQAYHRRFDNRTAELDVQASEIAQQNEIAEVENDWPVWHAQIKNALRVEPSNGNAKEVATAKRFFKKVEEIEESEPNIIDQVSAMILIITKELHQYGTTLHKYEQDQLTAKNPKPIRARDLRLGLVDRLNTIIRSIQQNKSIAFDCVLSERKIHCLAWAPNMVAAQKELWQKLNEHKADEVADLKAKTRPAEEGQAVSPAGRSE